MTYTKEYFRVEHDRIPCTRKKQLYHCNLVNLRKKRFTYKDIFELLEILDEKDLN